MARPSSPRLLSSFLGDRLALSSRPLLLRSAAPGTCPHHLPRCHSVAVPVFQRVGPGQQFAEMAISCREQVGGVSGDENAMQLGGYPLQQEVSFHSHRTRRISCFRSRDDTPENNPRRLRPGRVSPRLSVPDHIQLPPYVNSRQRPGVNNGPEVHDEIGIECMRASGKLAAQVLKFAGTLVKPGITTDEIDKAVHQMIIDNGAYPSPLGYCGYPKSVCTSVNECICHGIPDSRPLEDGDIINIDVTVYLNVSHSKLIYQLKCFFLGVSLKLLCFHHWGGGGKKSLCLLNCHQRVYIFFWITFVMIFSRDILFF
ncbi:Methionine aminopeptidase 1D, chloroplastic/mitochondrial [Dichanthelium oligosanthes]|uniref:Methionine aminopeptidase 1D, chloroplastic/mitochondrial n=1 Tax=Dichanthelium oligosanthes TaxID=888268 RepID=A0A1E5UIR3_9POAL|nr:Methionine aminopeptidase 1D, chloroplastic/mitochondrial [Dichanthelium oligosanthes]